MTLVLATKQSKFMGNKYGLGFSALKSPIRKPTMNLDCHAANFGARMPTFHKTYKEVGIVPINRKFIQLVNRYNDTKIIIGLNP